MPLVVGVELLLLLLTVCTFCVLRLSQQQNSVKCVRACPQLVSASNCLASPWSGFWYDLTPGLIRIYNVGRQGVSLYQKPNDSAWGGLWNVSWFKHLPEVSSQEVYSEHILLLSSVWTLTFRVSHCYSGPVDKVFHTRYICFHQTHLLLLLLKVHSRQLVGPKPVPKRKDLG